MMSFRLHDGNHQGLTTPAAAKARHGRMPWPLPVGEGILLLLLLTTGRTAWAKMIGTGTGTRSREEASRGGGTTFIKVQPCLRCSQLLRSSLRHIPKPIHHQPEGRTRETHSLDQIPRTGLPLASSQTQLWSLQRHAERRGGMPTTPLPTTAAPHRRKRREPE